MTAPGSWNVPPRRALPRLYSLAWFFYLLLAATAVVWIGMRRNGTIVIYGPRGGTHLDARGWIEYARCE